MLETDLKVWVPFYWMLLEIVSFYKRLSISGYEEYAGIVCRKTNRLEQNQGSDTIKLLETQPVGINLFFTEGIKLIMNMNITFDIKVEIKD